MASEVADAQPAASGAFASLPQAAADVSKMAVDNVSDSDTYSGSQSDPAALGDTAADDLEQDSKAVLKAGGQDADLKRDAGNGMLQDEDEDSRKAQSLAFAATTLKTFRNKLSGTVSSQDAGLAVEQHVDQLIKQATSLDNLCQLYEGWTSWI